MSSEFMQKVWELTKKIPKGRVTTYSEIARALNTRAYRAVGNALNKNPYNPYISYRLSHRAGCRDTVTVPCHRVVSADGSMGGFSKGVSEKRKILRREGVIIKNNRVVGFEKKLFRFNT